MKKGKTGPTLPRGAHAQVAQLVEHLRTPKVTRLIVCADSLFLRLGSSVGRTWYSLPVQCRKCGNAFPVWIVVDGVRRNLGSRVYCLTCVPFKQGRKIEYLQERVAYEFCVLCGRKNGSTRRRRCGSCNTRVRRYRTKAAAIRLLGGKCKDCGWSGPQAGFSFHHRHSKEFTIGNVANKSWSVIKKELKKCTLLCVRCHTIRHSDREDPRLVEEAEKYEGCELVW